MAKTHYRVGAVANALDADGIETVRRRTHDDLIDQLGPTRVSGVTWAHYTGPEAIAFYRELQNYRDETSGVDISEQMESFLMLNRDAVLVVAMADVEAP